MRLDKFLGEMNLGSRSQVKELVKKGRVQVNGIPVKDAAFQVLETEDEIAVDGNPLFYEAYVYYMLNKPQGVVSATRDNTADTVLSLIKEPQHKELFPVGRLDKDTEGLLLITNDGALAHRMLSPRKHVDKTYQVEIAHELSDDDIRALSEGVDIGDEEPTRPARVEVLNGMMISLTIHEGRFHQVKRMLLAVGNEVVSLKRVGFGPLLLDEKLKPGEYRRLTDLEVKAIHGA